MDAAPWGSLPGLPSLTSPRRPALTLPAASKRQAGCSSLCLSSGFLPRSERGHAWPRPRAGPGPAGVASLTTCPSPLPSQLTALRGLEAPHGPLSDQALPASGTCTCCSLCWNALPCNTQGVSTHPSDLSSVVAASGRFPILRLPVTDSHVALPSNDSHCNCSISHGSLCTPPRSAVSSARTPWPYPEPRGWHAGALDNRLINK